MIVGYQGYRYQRDRITNLTPLPSFRYSVHMHVGIENHVGIQPIEKCFGLEGNTTLLLAGGRRCRARPSSPPALLSVALVRFQNGHFCCIAGFSSTWAHIRDFKWASTSAQSIRISFPPSPAGLTLWDIFRPQAEWVHFVRIGLSHRLPLRLCTINKGVQVSCRFQALYISALNVIN
jgi:hypothetical protein